MIGSIRRPSAQNPRISKKIRGFQIIAESSGGFAKSVRHQWITRPYRSRGHRSDRRRETFLLIPIVYRVNHAGNSGSHCKENRAAERITKHGADKESEHSVKHHGDKRYDSPEIFHRYNLRILIIRIKKIRKPLSVCRRVFDGICAARIIRISIRISEELSVKASAEIANRRGINSHSEYFRRFLFYRAEQYHTEHSAGYDLTDADRNIQIPHGIVKRIKILEHGRNYQRVCDDRRDGRKPWRFFSEQICEYRADKRSYASENNIRKYSAGQYV